MLNVTISLTLGNRLYDQHCIAMRLRRSQLAALDRLEILLPSNVTFDAQLGDDCSLEIDGGEGAAIVFTGQLSHVQHTLSGLHIESHNGGLMLARYRPTVSFEQQTIGDIIGSLCTDVDVDIAANVEGATLALYVADGRATAAQEIARLALLAGAAAAFDEEGHLHVSEDGGPGGELALRYGREIITGGVGNTLANENTIIVVGEGGGDPNSAEARWIITDFMRGGGNDAGPNMRKVAQPELRTSADTEFAAAALTQSRTAGEAQVRLRTWLYPELQPGMRIEFADMPDSLPLQECRIRQVISTLLPGQMATTDVWATGQVSGASEFGDLLGALGGLL